MNCRKVVSAGVLSTVGTVLMTTSKSSLLYLWTLKSTAPLQQWYVAMMVAVLVPEVMTVLRTLWGATLLVSGTLRQWPSARVLLLGIVTTVLETAAMTFFTLEVASSLPPYAVLPLMHVMLLLQILLNQWEAVKRRHQTLNLTSEERVWSVVVSCVLSVLGLGLLLGVSVMMTLWGVAPTSRSLALPACLLALSLAWCRPVRQRVFCLHTSSLPTRHNVTLMLGVVRVGLVVGFSLLTTTLGVEGTDLSAVPAFLWTGLVQLHTTRTLMWALVLHCLTSVAACLLTRLGAYYNATRSAMVIPTTLSTLVASALFLIHCTHVVHVPLGLALCAVRSFHLTILTLSVCVWLVPFLALRSTYFQPSDVLFRPEIEAFFSMNYNSVCFDQNLFLDYNPFSVTFSERVHVGAKQTRVFMCTTMYREADYEMEQLLNSLSQVSRSEQLKKANVYLESHIFLDNGADDFTLKEFALQLMSLIETCISVTREDSVIYKTPYGIQIRCVLAGGMPLFLHLKDSSLVKAKKRWSQVMYMKYILDHRIKITSCQNAYVNTNSVCITVSEDDWRPRKEKNDEILLQVHSLLEHGDLKATLKIPGQGSSTGGCRDISEQSSDQGTGDDDDMSTISDVSSRKDESVKPSHDDGLSRCTRQATTVIQSSSYGSLTSTYFLRGVENPVYVSDDDEDEPPRQLPDTESDCTSIQPEAPQEVPDVHDSSTYILATDADVMFTDCAVLDLVTSCNEDRRLGAACGRTFPIGKKVNPIVWQQVFEYAKDFWLIKSSQNVIGTVMCCPGCFSLYRVQAINDMLQHYTEPTTGAADVFTKDTGEDRWMCTLMMLRGWKMRFCSQAVNSTYCPDTISEFFKQRRRWILSDVANTFIAFRRMLQLMTSNGSFSFIYALYLLQLFFLIVFSPGTTIVILTVGVELLTGAPYHVIITLLFTLCVLYCVVCCLMSPRVQIRVTKVCTVVLGLATTVVIVATAVYVFKDMVETLSMSAVPPIEHCLLVLLLATVLYAALLHPSECYLLAYGVVSIFYLPAMQLLLPFYSICNIVDQSWGTRDDQKPKVPKLVCFPRIRRRKKKKDKTPTSVSCEHLAQALWEQNQGLAPEEERFWRHLADNLIGKDVNQGLTTGQLAGRLRSLRNKAVVIFLTINLLWVAGLSTFYLWSLQSSSSNSAISIYGILIGCLYAFPLLVQILGMTLHCLQDGLYHLGNWIYGTEQPHYVHCADER